MTTYLLAAPEYSALMINGHGQGRAAQHGDGCARTCYMRGRGLSQAPMCRAGLSSRIAHHVCLRLAALAFLKFALVRFKFTGSSGSDHCPPQLTIVKFAPNAVSSAISVYCGAASYSTTPLLPYYYKKYYYCYYC